MARSRKTANYYDAVAWIACNDSPGDNDTVEVLKGLVTVCMVADLFNVDNEKVASDVASLRTSWFGRKG